MLIVVCLLMQAWLQKQQHHRTALQTEHRSLKQAIGAACFAFDESLIALQRERDAAEAALSMAGVQKAALLASHEQQLHLQLQLEQVAEQLRKVAEDVQSKRAMANDVIQTIDK